MLNRLVSRASVLLDILLVDEVDFYLFFFLLADFTAFATQSSP